MSSKKVNEVKDSIMVVKEKEVFERITAYITEVFREKKSQLHGSIVLIDLASNKNLSNTPLHVFNDFTGYGCNFSGNKNALTNTSIAKMDACL